jgi:hypothetical protein
MRRIALRKRRPLQAKARKSSKENAGAGFSSVWRADGLFSVEYRAVFIEIAHKPHRPSSAATSEDALLMEQFFANDSLGG